MTALLHSSFMSVEAYLQLDRSSADVRYEYIDGHVTMLAGGTLNHSLIGVNITGILSNLLRDTPCRVYNSDARVRLARRRYVYPDATVSCDERDDGETDILQSPRVVIEVLSPGTANKDRGEKFVCYRECPTIQEYMLIDSQHPVVEVFRREQNTFWTLYIFGLDDTVELTSIGVSFPVRDIYRHVTLRNEDTAPETD